MNTNYERNGQRGSFRLIILLVVGMGASFWVGGQGVYTALRNRQPVQLNYSDLAKGKPTAHWLVLTNCELQVAGSAYLIRKSKYDATGQGRITEAYIPIYAPGQDESATCYAVMATKDERMLALLEEMRQANDETQAAQFLQRHAKELQVRRDVEGLVRFGIDESHNEKAKLAGLRGNLAPDFILLSEGQKPNLGRSLGFLGLGLIIGTGMVLYFRANREETTADAY
jgi:hypothetical protein